jgi:hypothetical protein
MLLHMPIYMYNVIYAYLYAFFFNYWEEEALCIKIYIDLHIIDISGFGLQEVELELELGPSGPDFKQIALIPCVETVLN